MLRTAAVALALLALSSGCLAGVARVGNEAATDAMTGSEPVVIAMIDSGTTPYYPVFWGDASALVAMAVDHPFETVRMELPTGQDPIERDEGLWDSLTAGVLYQFEGTRLLGMSFSENRSFHHVRDAQQHGISTSYLAARDSPAAIIVMLQVDLGLCAPDPSCTFSPTIADAMEWVARQAWIDVVSVSLGMPANAPDESSIHPEVARYLAASRAAALSGKLIVNGAGNDATPPLTDHFNGPPWVVAIGGVDPTSRGEHIRASKTVDVVANFTDYAPEFGEGDMAWRSGTSIATPIVAGTLAHALHLVRRADPSLVVTPQMVRAALNASAVYFSPTEWDPTPPGREPILDDITRSLSAPILIQPQMGWGYVEAALAPEIARRILENDLGTPAGKEQARVFQAQWQQAREEYWNAYS